MTTKQCHANKKTAIIFGGRSPIALSCVEFLATSQRVILVSRRADAELTDFLKQFPAVSLVTADLQKSGDGARVIEMAYSSHHHITSIAFFQRYRAALENNFNHHMAVEIWSINEVLDAVRTFKPSDARIQVLVSSSPAASRVVIDQDLNYHIVKSGQEAIVRYQAVALARHNISINAVRIGSVVIKQRALNYWNSIPETLDTLRSLTPSQKVPTSELVGETFAKILMADIHGITGQIFTADEGFDLRDSIQMVKEVCSNNEIAMLSGSKTHLKV